MRKCYIHVNTGCTVESAAVSSWWGVHCTTSSAAGKGTDGASAEGCSTVHPGLFCYISFDHCFYCYQSLPPCVSLLLSLENALVSEFIVIDIKHTHVLCILMLIEFFMLFFYNFLWMVSQLLNEPFKKRPIGCKSGNRSRKNDTSGCFCLVGVGALTLLSALTLSARWQRRPSCATSHQQFCLRKWRKKIEDNWLTQSHVSFLLQLFRNISIWKDINKMVVVISIFVVAYSMIVCLLLVAGSGWLLQRMEDEAMELRLSGETQQKMVSSLQDEQSAVNSQLTQLQLAVQEKDSRIQCVYLCACILSYLMTKCTAYPTYYTHTHTRLMDGPFPGLPGWASTRKAKPIWILLKQETVSGSGISWAICKSAPSSRQITMPAPTTQFFTGRMPFLPPNQQCQSTEGKIKSYSLQR